MARFYQPDLSENIDSPFVRDGANKLVRRSYWLDMDDWPAPGSEDTELGVFMEPEVSHGETEVYSRVQA